MNTRRLVHLPAVPEWSDFDDGHGKDCIFLESTLSVRLNMNGPNNGQNQQQPRPQTKAEIVAQREQVRMLGIALGNWREAARQVRACRTMPDIQTATPTPAAKAMGTEPGLTRGFT